MRVVKRNGDIEAFDQAKIRNAISKANHESSKKLTDSMIDNIVKKIVDTIRDPYSKYDSDRVGIEDIQDLVENNLIDTGYAEVAKKYIIYRYQREMVRKFKQRDNNILDLIKGENEELNTENSNKNSHLISTMRDYIAGEVCKDIADRVLLPKDVVEAHNNCVLHFHDKDYSPLMPMFNCCLVDIGDMLNNGTCINGTMIETPHSFLTACTITTQVIAAISSNEFGGQSVNIKHLSKYLKKSYDKYVDMFNDEHIAHELMLKELKDGVQTIQYQINTITSTNGQTPFVTIFLELDDKDEYLDYTAMIIEEILKQRIQGVKNEVGAWVTPTFPKLVYVLDKNNNLTGGKFDHLTKLAARCTAKRMYPDYISAKIMRERYDGNVFSPMGCLDGSEIVSYKLNGKLYVESFKRMWFRLSKIFDVKIQPNNYDEYIDLDNVEIYDSLVGFTKCKRIIRNHSSRWLDVCFDKGRRLLCTPDHPFETVNRGIVEAQYLTNEDQIVVNYNSYCIDSIEKNVNEAWFLGFMLCDGCYQNKHIYASINAVGEDDIADKWDDVVTTYYSMTPKHTLHERDKKGNYIDLSMRSNGSYSLSSLIQYFTELFGGINKKDRHIPNEVFSWNKEAKLAFLAGMIDADGYINSTTHGGAIIQIGSTNKELALQQLYLAQCLGMEARLYHNHYSKTNKNLIRYRIEFYPSEDLINFIVCKKKLDNYIPRTSPIKKDNVSCVYSITNMFRDDFSYDVVTESEHFEVSGVYSHNCRSFLSPWRDENGNFKFEGRFNCGVVSINLPQIALELSQKYGLNNLYKNHFDEFKTELDRRLELCFKALEFRRNSLRGVKSDVSPIHWQYGAIARLKKGETIDKLLDNGYSTISLGYIGLYEVTKLMTGESHTGKIGHEFAVWIMEYLRSTTDKWKKETKAGYALYGTPAETLCYRFAKHDKQVYGSIKDITDKNYYTNSFHVDVRESIDAFSKFKFETDFQKISSGGCISFCEIPNVQNNPEVIEEVLKFIYEYVQYGEFNTKLDYCMVCGYDSELMLDDENHWYCPNCGNHDTNKMNIVRRTCGYLGANLWNNGKTEEIRQRVLHLGME